MTLPERENITLPARRDAPWEPGWGPIPSAVLYPMMCSRDNLNPRVSTIQYHAQSLVYGYAENGSEFDWHARPEQHVRAEIIRTMPSEDHQDHECTIDCSYEDTRRTRKKVEWVR